MKWLNRKTWGLLLGDFSPGQVLVDWVRFAAPSLCASSPSLCASSQSRRIPSSNPPLARSAEFRRPSALMRSALGPARGGPPQGRARHFRQPNGEHGLKARGRGPGRKGHRARLRLRVFGQGSRSAALQGPSIHGATSCASGEQQLTACMGTEWTVVSPGRADDGFFFRRPEFGIHAATPGDPLPIIPAQPSFISAPSSGRPTKRRLVL
jgi:hypothetical protein